MRACIFIWEGSQVNAHALTHSHTHTSICMYGMHTHGSQVCMYGMHTHMAYLHMHTHMAYLHMQASTSHLTLHTTCRPPSSRGL